MFVHPAAGLGPSSSFQVNMDVYYCDAPNCCLLFLTYKYCLESRSLPPARIYRVVGNQRRNGKVFHLYLPFPTSKSLPPPTSKTILLIVQFAVLPLEKTAAGIAADLFHA